MIEAAEKGYEMKKIEATIRPFRIGDVREALEWASLGPITATEGIGYFINGKTGQSVICRGAEHVTDNQPIIKLEMVLNAEKCDAAVNAILRGASTGRSGDGIIIISDVERVAEIHT